MFVDDSLSVPDSPRSEAIPDMLLSPAGEMQIIMTTCHHDRHRRLSGATKRMNTGNSF